MGEFIRLHSQRLSARLGKRMPRVVRGLDRTEVAAWFHVATVLLNLDEVITKG